MILNDYEFWNEYKDLIQIKYDRILVDAKIKSFLKRGNLKELEKAWRRQTYQHLYYVMKGLDIGLDWICMDLGAGVGRIAKELINFCFKIVCYDIAPNIVKEGKKYCKGDNIEFHLVKKDSIGRANNSIDFIYSMLTFQHFHEEGKFIDYLTRLKYILKPKGFLRFQFCTDDRVHPEEKTNFNGLLYNEGDINKLTEDLGFKVIGYDHQLGDATWDWITLQK